MPVNLFGNGRNLAVASVVVWMLLLSVSGGAQPASPPGATPSALPASAAFPTPPPLPSPSPVVDTYFGTRVVDPYRYFENMQDPVVQRFFKAESDYTNAVLARLGAPREALFQRIRALDRVGVGVGDLIRVRDRYFFEKTSPNDVSAKLYVRAARDGTQRLLLDPQRFVTGPGKHETLDFFVPSLNGAYVAVGVSEGGSENDVTHVLRVADGALLPEAITRTRFGVTGWDPSGKAFYYNRLPQLPPNAPPTEQELRPIVYRHVLGTPVARDRKVFGIGVVPGIAIAPTDTASISTSPASPYALATVAHGVRNEITLYAEPLAALEADRPAWRKIFDVDADVTDFDVDGDVIYAISHHDAPNFKVLAIRIDRPSPATARTVVPPSKTLLVRNVSVASDGLYVGERNGGLGRIVRFRLAADGTPVGGPQAVRLPYQGNVLGLVTDPREHGTTFGLTGWTKSLLYYATRPDLTVFDTKLKPPAPIDASAYTSSEVLARSADGTPVPLSIVYRRGIALDGSHPTYLEGYGAYGTTITPYFSTTRLAWLEHNGVYAVCHPRGGGWYGEAWHRAGMIATKEHTIQDFIACGQYLVDKGYTTPARLAGEGTSAGGILIGGAITQAPQLFAAALDIAGVSDALRTEFEPNGPPNIPEFGSVKTATGFRALYAMDAYQHVRDGVAYPAVMLVTGINDPRVAPWELAKLTARLQAASSSGRPILLWVGYDSGHGFLGASREQTERLLADQYAFLLWQLGDPAFASIPPRIVSVPRPTSSSPSPTAP